jgi:hypothetical protein
MVKTHLNNCPRESCHQKTKTGSENGRLGAQLFSSFPAAAAAAAAAGRISGGAWHEFSLLLRENCCESSDRAFITEFSSKPNTLTWLLVMTCISHHVCNYNQCDVKCTRRRIGRACSLLIIAHMITRAPCDLG